MDTQPNDETLVQAVQLQCDAMLVQARSAAERGYCVVVHGLNYGADNNAFLHGYMSGGFARFVDDWCALHRRKLVTVHVNMQDDLARARARQTGRPFEQPFQFHARLPRTRRWRPICAALELMSAKVTRVGGRREARGTGVFTHRAMADCHEYGGEGRTALSCLLGVFHMPPHRAIMTGE